MENGKSNVIVSISAQDIYQHPDNPRKDLGDLSELSDSIAKILCAGREERGGEIMKQGTLNRKQYDKIRKMDHGQMQDYFGGVYALGYEAGVKAASEKREVPELVGLEDELLSIRGIGSAKARLICEKVREFLERKAGHDETGVEISGE